MRLVVLDDLTDDMVLAKPLYQDIGMILLSEGATNLTKYRDKIKKLGFEYVYVEDEVSQGIQIDDVVSKEVRLEGQKMANNILSNLVKDKAINTPELRKWIEDIICEIIDNKAVMINMVDFKAKDTYLYSHSVNVAVLSLLIGRTMQYTAKQLNFLGVGAILHDIGMLMLPEDLWHKEYHELSAEEQAVYRTHPQLGYEVLKSIYDVDAFSKLIVWRHHEQIDGNGYPCKINGDELNEMIKIVSICDIYDELTSIREKGVKMPSYQAIEYLISNAGVKFDKKILAKFLRCVAIFPLGSTVVLNDGRKAIVERQNENFPTRPVVRLLEGARSSVDLLKEVNVVIQGFA